MWWLWVSLRTFVIELHQEADTLVSGIYMYGWRHYEKTSQSWAETLMECSGWIQPMVESMQRTSPFLPTQTNNAKYERLTNWNLLLVSDCRFGVSPVTILIRNNLHRKTLTKHSSEQDQDSLLVKRQSLTRNQRAGEKYIASDIIRCGWVCCCTKI